MDYQAERLGLIVELAQQSMDIVQRFSNDPVSAGNIQTASGPIKNLKQVSAEIKSEGELAISSAVVELIDTLKTETAVDALIDGLTDTAVLAEASAARAELAAAYANVKGNIYDSTAIGLLPENTVSGQYFSTPAGNGSDLLILYKNEAGVAREKDRYPNAQAVSHAITTTAAEVSRVRSDLNGAGQENYTGAGPIFPFVTDAARQVLLGYNADKQAMFGVGLMAEAAVPAAVGKTLAALDQAKYLGAGPIYPIVTDSANHILLGYDVRIGKFVGAGLDEHQEPAAWPVPVAVNHLLLYGESLAVGAAGSPVLSTTQPYSNITFNGGPRASAGDYSAFKPLTEDALPAPDGVAGRGETSCSGAANYASKLSAQHNGVLPQDHIILSSTAGHGGYTIQQLEKDAEWYAKLLEHVNAAKALNGDYAVHSVVWIQGSNGAQAMDYTTYYTKLVKLMHDIDADIRSITGQASYVHLHTAQISYQVRLNSATALAQLHAVQRNERLGFIAPCYHLPFATDKVHLTNRGYKWLGAYAGRAYQQTVHEHRKPDFLEPVSAVVTGRTVRVHFNVPTAPLVFDTTTLAVTTDHGFAIKDASGTLAIESFSLGETHVDVTLVAPPLAGATVRYALDYMAPALRILDGGSGNLRDSTPDAEMIGGTLCPLYHVAPHFELRIIESKEI